MCIVSSMSPTVENGDKHGKSPRRERGMYDKIRYGERLISLCWEEEPCLRTVQQILKHYPEAAEYTCKWSKCDALFAASSTRRANKALDLKLIKMLLYTKMKREKKSNEELDNNSIGCNSISTTRGGLVHETPSFLGGDLTCLEALVEANKIHVLSYLENANPPNFHLEDIQTYGLLGYALDYDDTEGIHTLRWLLERDPLSVTVPCTCDGECLIQIIHTFDKRIQLSAYRNLIGFGVAQGMEARAGLLLEHKSAGSPDSGTAGYALKKLVEIADLPMVEYMATNNPPVLLKEDIGKYNLIHCAARNVNSEVLRFLQKMSNDDSSIKCDECGIRPIQVIPSALAQTEGYRRERILDNLALLVEEGLRRNLGGEYGIGGLLMPMKKFGDKGDNADTRTVLGRIMKLSIEQGNRCLFPSTVAKVRGILAKFKAPFLHALIICPNHDLKEYMKFIISWSKWCLNETDSKGQLPLHAAITRRSIGNKHIVVRHLIRAGPLAVKAVDNESGLYPFALAAAQPDSDLNLVYELYKYYSQI
jgi:hypothetical protein